jgi:SAM-dependent methyltransferase
LTTDRVSEVQAAWGARVRANREQVDRFREVPDGADFYGPVSSIFRADPHRTDDPTLERLLRLARPTDTWLDIGAGAGRFALPLALVVREVIAVEPSESMLDGLREGMHQASIGNVRVIQERWPARGQSAASDIQADVALIAHVGYDVEDIGPFLDAMEAAAGRLLVAILMERSPASGAYPFWREVFGEPRVPLPALPDFTDLLLARGAEPVIEVLETGQRIWASHDEILGFLRRQLWVKPGGRRDRLLGKQLEAALSPTDGGWELENAEPNPIGIVTWRRSR